MVHLSPAVIMKTHAIKNKTPNSGFTWGAKSNDLLRTCVNTQQVLFWIAASWHAQSDLISLKQPQRDVLPPAPSIIPQMQKWLRISPQWLFQSFLYTRDEPAPGSRSCSAPIAQRHQAASELISVWWGKISVHTKEYNVNGWIHLHCLDTEVQPWGCCLWRLKDDIVPQKVAGFVTNKKTKTQEDLKSDAHNPLLSIRKQ